MLTETLAHSKNPSRLFRQATRLQQSVLAGPEKRVLVWMAKRTPEWITPDHLTVLGFLSQLMTGVSYAVAQSNQLGLTGAIIFLILNWRFRTRKYDGQIFFEGLALYSILRFVVEWFRGDDYRGYVLGGMVSYSQLVSLGILPIAVWAIFHFSRQKS